MQELRLVTNKDLTDEIELDAIEADNEQTGDVVDTNSMAENLEAKMDEAIKEGTSNLSGKIDDLSSEVEATTQELEKLKSLETRLETEDIVVQEKNWLEERTREQRLAEDRYREELFEKQRMLEEKRKTQTEAFAQNKQMKVYNQMHEEEQNDLIYALHGVSSDMIEGMGEYKNALFQGMAIILLLTGAAICGITAYMYGFQSKIFLACIALLAANTTLLPRENFGKLQGGLYNGLSKLLFILPTPVMGVLLVTQSMEPAIFNLIMEWLGVGVAALCLYGALGFCLRNPYRSMRKLVRAARADIKDLKKTASKTVKKNIKTREKMENKLLKRKEKQENKLETLKKKEQDKIERIKKREEEKSQKIAAKLLIEKEKQERREEIAEARRANREKNKELYDQKIASFKAIFKKSSQTAKDKIGALTDKDNKDSEQMSDNEKKAM